MGSHTKIAKPLRWFDGWFSFGGAVADTALIRRCQHSQTGWNSGDLDVAFQLFSCGMVWDGNLTSKSSRDHLVACGYAVRHQGMQAMTGKGVIAFLKSPAVYRSALRRWRSGRNPFTADRARIEQAMT
jgi:hypothetical protein